MKLSYRKYPVLKLADKKYLKENQETFRNLLKNAPQTTYEEKVLHAISQSLVLEDGLLTGKPIYFATDRLVVPKVIEYQVDDMKSSC